MKDLLHDAAHKVLVDGWKMFRAMKKEVKTLETKEDKLNLLYETREKILRKYEKLTILEEKANVQFPEENVLGIDVEEAIYQMNMWLENLLNEVQEAYTGTMED